MSGVFYAIFVVAILVVIRWYIRNERKGLGGAGGILAMRGEDIGDLRPSESAARSRFRRTNAPSAFRSR